MTAVGARPAREARAAIEAAYASIDRALVARDEARMLAPVSPTFVLTAVDGTRTDRTEHAALVHLQLAGNPVLGPAETEIESLEEGPREVTTVVRRTVWTADSFGAFRWRDTWTRADGRWLLERREELGLPEWGSAVPTEPAGSPRLARLRADLTAGDEAALDAFWAEVTGHAPLIEPHDGDPALALVTFVWRSTQEAHVELAAGMPWTSDKAFRRVAGSDVWYLTQPMPVTGRLNYLIAVRGTTLRPGVGEIEITRELHDPLNGRQAFVDSSWFELAGAPPQPHLAERPGVPKGNLVRASLWSTELGEERAYSVYTPHGYRADGEDNRLLVVFDGETYGAGPAVSVPTPTIVDNLLADGLIPQLAILLVHNPWDVRARDLPCSPAFAAFVARELVPSIQDRYGAGLRPEHVVVAGSSYGGLASAFCALRHPGVFGNVLSMSGSFWHSEEWLPGSSQPFGGGEGLIQREFAAGRRLPLRFWLAAGRLEPDTIVATNRQLRRILELKGYPVEYSEFDGNHTYACWRGAIADGLVALLGTSAG